MERAVVKFDGGRVFERMHFKSIFEGVDVLVRDAEEIDLRDWRG